MSKSAVVYFSVTDNTAQIAKIIAEETGSDIYEIQAKEPYSEDDINWQNRDSRANLEQNDASARPEIANAIDVSEYDTIYLGYPIWWYTMPKIIDTFIETGALSGKKVAAFCTSGSSDIEKSVSALKTYGLDIIGSQRFNIPPSNDEIKTWLNNLAK